MGKYPSLTLLATLVQNSLPQWCSGGIGEWLGIRTPSWGVGILLKSCILGSSFNAFAPQMVSYDLGVMPPEGFVPARAVAGKRASHGGLLGGVIEPP